MSNIGLFGGTFNPVHSGHIRLLKSVLDKMDFEKVIVLPDRIPPHKQAHNLVSGKQRSEMCRLAFEDMPSVEISDFELKRSGKSYSVYTVRHFKELYPNDRLCFIMGSDMLLIFDKWYKYEEILSMATLVCISREDEDTTKKLSEYAQKLTEKGGEVIVLDTPPMELSSSEIREKLRNSEDCSCYLPEKIVQYICENNLYK